MTERRNAIVRFMTTPTEKRAIVAAAREAQLSMADWCRETLGAAVLEQLLRDKDR